MRDAFLQAFDAALLPRIIPIGDIDEDEIAFAEAAAGDIAAEALSLPEALGGLERRLLLTQLIAKWAQSPELHGTSGTPLVAQTPASACALADDLARLIDDMTTRNVSWDRLGELVPDKFDIYWQLTLRFLQIAHQAWPNVLRERNCIEPAERRDRLIKAEAARLTRKTDGLVIAAGSTGSIPATAELIATIAHLPHGAVVLPGLDTDLDEDAWTSIAGDDKKNIAPAPAHPQFAIQALLTRIGITRADVVALAAPHGRERLVSEALRPAAATDRWRQISADPAFAAHADTAIKTLTVIEAANPEEEALAIAVALREAMHDGKTAALVTPDRALGRRVLNALARWNIAAEDSGGDALADTPAGTFAQTRRGYGSRRARAGAVTRLAQTSAVAPAFARQGPCRCRTRASDLARPAAAGRQRRARERAAHFPQEQNRFASLGSAHRADRCRIERGVRSRRLARRRTQAA